MVLSGFEECLIADTFENLVSDASTGGSADGGSCLNPTKFDNYLKQVLALPTSVHEGPSFGYEAASSLKTCFPTFSVSFQLILNNLIQDP